MSIETQNAISDLRKLLDDVTEQKATGQLSQETASAVRRSLLNLRRAHAKLRESQSESAKEASDAVEQFKKARLQLENSRFLESQCQYLSEKYESTQTPELDKVSVFLPTVVEFTRNHSGDHDFVSYEADPHQFMLAMLSNELSERKKLEESISSLESTRDTLHSQITKKQKFLSSMSSKLSELTKSVSSIKALFPVASESVTAPTAPIPFADQLVATPQLFMIAGKFWSTLPHTAINVDSGGDVRELMVRVSPLPTSSSLAPSGTSLEVQLKFRQKQSDPNVTLSVTPQGIYPTLLEDITSASVPVDTVVDNIRGAVLHLMWSAYEVAVFSSLKIPVIQGSIWGDNETVLPGGGVSVTGFALASPGLFRIKLKIGSQESELGINMVDKTLVIQRHSDGRNAMLVSRVDGDIGGDAPVLVDLQLANLEETVTTWWRSQAEKLGKYAFGELTAVVMKCISSM